MVQLSLTSLRSVVHVELMGRVSMLVFSRLSLHSCRWVTTGLHLGAGRGFFYLGRGEFCLLLPLCCEVLAVLISDGPAAGVTVTLLALKLWDNWSKDEGLLILLDSVQVAASDSEAARLNCSISFSCKK